MAVTYSRSSKSVMSSFPSLGKPCSVCVCICMLCARVRACCLYSSVYLYVVCMCVYTWMCAHMSVRVVRIHLCVSVLRVCRVHMWVCVHVSELVVCIHLCISVCCMCVVCTWACVLSVFMCVYLGVVCVSCARVCMVTTGSCTAVLGPSCRQDPVE